MKKVKFITKNTLTGEEGTRMTITNDGKIGIGTETPGKVLDVSGDIHFSGTLFQNGQVFTSGADLATSSISELSDVNLTGISTNQGVKWDGAKLVPTSLSTGGEGGGGFSDLTTFLISDLSNVNLSGITAGQGIQWDGAKIVPADATTKMASLVPLAHNTYSLGTPTNVWKDVYIGPGSLYIDGQKVIESDSNTIIMGADANQNLKLKGSGTGQIQIETTSNNINIQTIGAGDVVLGSTGTGTVKITKNISLLDGVEIQNIGGTHVTVNDNLNVTGTILVNNITEKTSAHGVVIDGVTIKDGDISTNSLTVNGVQVTGGGSTIDNTTDISVNHLDVTGNLKVDDRLTIGKEHQNPIMNKYEITFNNNNSYDNWFLFDMSNNNGVIPANTDWIIEYEHKMTRGNATTPSPDYSHFALIIEGPNGVTSNTFSSNTYFMYWDNWNGSDITLRYSPDNITSNIETSIGNIGVALDTFVTDYVKVKWEYKASSDTIKLYFNNQFAQSRTSGSNSSNVYGRWGFGDWNANIHDIKNPRVTIDGNIYNPLPTVNSTSTTTPTIIGSTTIYSLDVSGNGFFSGTIRASSSVLSSDDRLKHNETIPITPLNTIMKVEPKHYFKTKTMYDASHNFPLDASGYPVDFSNNRLVEGKDYTRETGIIAQDLQPIPELNYTVKSNGANEPLGVDYNSIHCTHIAATKELHSMVKSQQTITDDHVKKINALTTLYAVQKQKTENLEAVLAAIKQHLGI
jgi:hypothetical protein